MKDYLAALWELKFKHTVGSFDWWVFLIEYVLGFVLFCIVFPLMLPVLLCAEVYDFCYNAVGNLYTLHRKVKRAAAKERKKND